MIPGIILVAATIAAKTKHVNLRSLTECPSGSPPGAYPLPASGERGLKKKPPANGRLSNLEEGST